MITRARDSCQGAPAPSSDADGIVVALAYRLMTIVVAAIGVVYYWTSRGEVQTLLEEAEEEQRREADEGLPGLSGPN